MINRSWLALAAVGGLLFVGACACAAEEPLGIGRFHVGMTFDEARAAANVAWEPKGISAFTRKTLSIVGARAETLGGLAHDVEIAPGYYGHYVLRLVHRAEVADAAECERMAVAIVGDLEQRFGALTPPGEERPTVTTKMPSFQSQRMPDGSFVVLPVPGSGIAVSPDSPRVKAGTSSAIEFDARRGRKDPPLRTGATRRQHNDEDSISFESTYSRDDAKHAVCESRTVLEHRPPRPRSEPLAFSPSLVQRDVSVAVKHHTLDGLEPPTEPVTVGVDCTVSRLSGEMTCTARDDAARNAGVYAEVAELRASSMALDPAGFDPDNPLPLLTSFDVTIAPEDRRPLDFGNGPFAPLTGVRWLYVPAKGDLERFYPTRMLERGFERLVSVACQIQTDGSTICMAIDPPPGPESKMPLDAFEAFSDAAVRIMRAYTAAPTLVSGAPSAGTVVRGQVDFRLAK
ncbi:MAG TPA: hypothetical protein VFJ95_15570 [Gammaproteobacteria bacterium]|nr:hypothetical protein [Gammaproteobacteria bacterium]